MTALYLKALHLFITHPCSGSVINRSRCSCSQNVTPSYLVRLSSGELRLLFIPQLAARLPPDQAGVFLALMMLQGRSFSPADVIEAVQLNRDFPSALRFLTHTCPICRDQVSFSKVRGIARASQSERTWVAACTSCLFFFCACIPADHHHDPLLLFPVLYVFHGIFLRGHQGAMHRAAGLPSVWPTRGQRSGGTGRVHGLLQPAGHTGERHAQVRDTHG